jgi:ribosome-binding protein aMBF1 (putative translation factor)
MRANGFDPNRLTYLCKVRRWDMNQTLNHKTESAPILNSDVVIGENVAARRRAFGWSRAKLAELLGQSDAWVRRIEEGQKLSPDEFYAIAEMLNIENPRVLLKPDYFY